MSFGQYLKQKRVQAGLSQSQVSNKLGYTTSQFVSNWERGISEPPVKDIKKIALLYGVSAEGIFDAVLKNKIAEVTESLKRKFKKAA